MAPSDQALELQISPKRETKEWILSLFDMEVDEEGFIVESSETGRRVLSRDGEELRVEEWIGIDKGSLAFIRGSAQEILRIARKDREQDELA